MVKTRRHRPINKNRSNTNRNRSNRSNRNRKYLGGTHSPSKSMDLVPFNRRELTRSSSINDKELTITNIQSSKIFEGFYELIHKIFPRLSKQKFSKVFLKFITTTDFSEFLQFMPDFKDLSVLEMNKYMILVSEQLNSIVTSEITGNSIGPTPTHSNRLLQVGGDIGLIMIHFIISILVTIALPPSCKKFFVALIICFLISNIRDYSRDPDYSVDSAEIFPLVVLEGSGAVVAITNWVRIILGYALDYITNRRVQNLSHRTVNEVEVEQHVSDTPARMEELPPYRPRRQSLYLQQDSPHRPGPRSELKYRRTPNPDSR